MSTALTTKPNAEAIERVVIGGDLGRLSAEERVNYYQLVCQSVGLNPLTKPFEYITLNGKLTLYARKDATDQLRSLHQVSVKIVAREVTEGCYVVTAQASFPSGRFDESIGAVPIENLKGEARANAMMKCETKAKRRVTLSACGLGMLDETEIETIPSANKPAADVARTTKPIPVDGPGIKPAAERSAVKGTADPQKAVAAERGVVDTVPPSRQPGEDSDDVVDFVPPLAEALATAIDRAAGVGTPKVSPDATIDLPKQRRLHRAFKDAIPANAAHATHKAAPTIFREWLRHEGFVIDGAGSTKRIPELLFEEVLANATKYAATLR